MCWVCPVAQLGDPVGRVVLSEAEYVSLHALGMVRSRAARKLRLTVQRDTRVG